MSYGRGFSNLPLPKYFTGQSSASSGIGAIGNSASGRNKKGRLSIDVGGGFGEGDDVDGMIGARGALRAAA